MSPEAETVQTYTLTSDNIVLDQFDYDAQGFALCPGASYWCAEKMMVERNAAGLVQPINVHHTSDPNVNAALDTMAAAIQAAVQTAYAALASAGAAPRFVFTDEGPHLAAARMA